METVSPAQISYRLRDFPLVFITHQAIGTWGPMLAAPEVVFLFAQVVWRFGGRFNFSQAQWTLYGTPYFFTHVGLGLFLGWVLGGTLRHRQMLSVWILPLLAVLSVMLGLPLPLPTPVELAQYPPMYHLTMGQYAALPFSGRMASLFSWGSGIQPFIQVVVTLPFYSATAYSLGALLAIRVLRAPAFFETMRSLIVKRVVLVVGVPWFCIKLAINFQSIAARYPEIHTWRGLFYILEGFSVESAFVTYVFAVSVAVVGRRFFVSRFFLRSK